MEQPSLRNNSENSFSQENNPQEHYRKNSQVSQQNKFVMYPKINLPIYLLFPYEYMDHLATKDFTLFKKIKDQTGVYNLLKDSLITLPNINCHTVYIFDEDSRRKLDATNQLLTHFLSKHQRNSPKKILRVLINENLVSLFIGKEGKNIKKLMDICRSNITVHREQIDKKFRPVEIEGHIDDVLITVREINKTMEYYARKKHSESNTPMIDESAISFKNITAKFILDKKVEKLLFKEYEQISQKLNVKVVYKIEDPDEEIKGLNSTDIVLIMDGKLQDLSNLFAEIYEKIIEEFYEDKNDELELKILIPNNFVNQIIGAKGLKIKEIGAKAGGAMIRINSDKKEEMHLKDCVVSIKGNYKKQIEANRQILIKLGYLINQEQLHQNQNFHRNNRVQNDFHNEQNLHLQKKDFRDDFDKDRQNYDNNFKERNFNYQGNYDKYNRQQRDPYRQHGNHHKQQFRNDINMDRRDQNSDNIYGQKFEKNIKKGGNFGFRNQYEQNQYGGRNDQQERNFYNDQMRGQKNFRDQRQFDDRYKYDNRNHYQGQRREFQHQKNSQDQFEQEQKHHYGEGRDQNIDQIRKNSDISSKQNSIQQKNDQQSQIRIIVANNQIKKFVDKNKPIVKEMQRNLNCKVQILKEDQTLYYSEGIMGRMIKFQGPIDNCLQFIKFFKTQLEDQENSVNK